MISGEQILRLARCVARRYSQSGQTTSDLTQEAALAIVEELKRRPDAGERLLYMNARGRLYRLTQKAQRRRAEPLGDHDPPDPRGERPDRDDDREELDVLLAQLPQRTRMVMELGRRGCGAKEISERSGLTLARVYSLRHRATKILRAALTDSGV